MDFKWQGRVDGDSLAHLRWHQMIKILPIDELSNSSLIVARHAHVLLGVKTDEGVTRNKGRAGAFNSPDLIRQQLCSVAIHHPIEVYDAGNLVCEDHDLEYLQQQQTETVDMLIDKGLLPIVLGGGHEIAYGNFMGLYHNQKKRLSRQTDSDDASDRLPKIGIINFDAHFDLRQQPQPSSGTPFYQIAEYLKNEGDCFNYFCLGISENGNTRALFDTADALNVSYIFDTELQSSDLTAVEAELKAFIEKVDCLYISIDLDVFSLALAPGVSAPAVLGVPLYVVERLLCFIALSQKIKLVDIAELNGNYDIDNHTSKLAAYLVSLLTKITINH